MTDNEIIRLILPVINAGLIAAGFDDVSVVQLNQPTQQGVNLLPTVFLTKINNKRYGFMRAYDVWDEDDETMVHTEDQYFESTYQISCLVLQDPSGTPVYTASDLVNEVAWILQSEATVTYLNANDVGVLRVSEVRNPYFVDDRDQFEANPTFDFTLSYVNSRVTTAPIITLPVNLELEAI